MQIKVSMDNLWTENIDGELVTPISYTFNDNSERGGGNTYLKGDQTKAKRTNLETMVLDNLYTKLFSGKYQNEKIEQATKVLEDFETNMDKVVEKAIEKVDTKLSEIDKKTQQLEQVTKMTSLAFTEFIMNQNVAVEGVEDETETNKFDA